MRHTSNERGIALVVAIVALVVVGALVAGAFFVGVQEQRVGLNSLKAQQAFAAAQEGAQLQVADWAGGTYKDVPVGDSATFAGALDDGTGWYRGSVTRMSTMIWMVESEGFSRDSTTRQKVGMIVRLRPIEIEIKAGLRTQGAIQIGGSAYINGYDSEPGAWTGCPALGDPLPGIGIPNDSLISYSGCSDQSCIQGEPKVEEDTTISDESLTTFGDVDFDELRSLATKVIIGGNRKIQPSLNGTVCNTADNNNFGDPLLPAAPCGGYFPIVYVTSDLTINGDQGQGVLIVDGNLSVQGGFQFFGPVIVRGILKTTGTGGHFHGGVVAANVSLEQNTVLGNAVINYSSCALLRSLTQSAPGALMQERSWVNLYN